MLFNLSLTKDLSFVLCLKLYYYKYLQLQQQQIKTCESGNQVSLDIRKWKTMTIIFDMTPYQGTWYDLKIYIIITLCTKIRLVTEIIINK